MSTALDLAALAAQGELKIPIARGVVSQGGSGTDYTGWSGVSSVFVEAKVEVRDQSRGFATLTLTVEGSSNGSDWSTLETFTFGHGGTQSATVSAPSDHLRVSWAVGGHSEWQIIEVTAAPSIIDTGGGGGSQPDGSVVPVADPTGATVDDTTYDNSWLGSGKLTTLVFPQSTVAIAIAVEGDDFPRILSLSNPTDGFFYGDGTIDPINGGAAMWIEAGAAGEFVHVLEGGGATQLRIGVPDANAGRTVVSPNGLSLTLNGPNVIGGAGDPNTNRGGNVGDAYIRSDGGDGSWVYRCTVAGVAGAATWVAKL